MQFNSYQDSGTQFETIILIQAIPQHSGQHILCLQYLGWDENDVIWMYMCVADENGCYQM